MAFAAELGKGQLVRPLIGVPRADLERYAQAMRLDWVEDPSNARLSLDRNYLRHQVMPLVRRRWPAMSTTLARSAAHCAEAAAVIDGAAGKALHGLGGQRPRTLSIPRLAALDPALRKAVLRLWLRRLELAPPDSAHMGRILKEVLPARADRDPLVTWEGCEIRRYRTDLFALRPLPPKPSGEELTWNGSLLDLPQPLGALELVGESPPGFQGVVPGQPLQVRFGVEGLRCRPPGAAHRRSLKGLFQAAGVPAWLRPYCPLVFDRERLVAVAGVCPCADQAGGEAVLAIRWTGHPWEELRLVR